MAMEVSMMQLGMLGTNCYLLKDSATGKGALIDPGGQAEVIEKVLTERGVELESVFLTHAHYDHTGAVADLLKAHPGLKVYLHDADAALGEDKAAMMPDAHLRTHGYGEGDTVTVGETALTVLHTPGHTPGGVCLVCGDLLFSGDTLFRGSMGRTDFPGGDDGAIFASLRRLAALEGDFRVCPGHESTSTLEAERQGNYYMKAALKR